jgi:hypothetical protein
MQLPLRFRSSLPHFGEPKLVSRTRLVPMVVWQSFLGAATVVDRSPGHIHQVLPAELRDR